MSLAYSLFIIISALILFLFLYYISLKNEKLLYKKRPSPIDLEMAEEIGIPIDIYNKIKLKNNDKKTYIRSFACNPNTIFSYWEVTEKEYYENQPTIRCYKKNNEYYEIIINPETDNWYLKGIEENQIYRLILGYKKNQKFIPLTISNPVFTPTKKISEKQTIKGNIGTKKQKYFALDDNIEVASLLSLSFENNNRSYENNKDKIKEW